MAERINDGTTDLGYFQGFCHIAGSCDVAGNEKRQTMIQTRKSKVFGAEVLSVSFNHRGWTVKTHSLHDGRTQIVLEHPYLAEPITGAVQNGGRELRRWVDGQINAHSEVGCVMLEKGER
jgi:hypothetical protein